MDGSSGNPCARVDSANFVSMSPTNELLDLLATRSAKRGSFTLASGRQSSLYIDARMTTMSPQGLALIGPLGLAAIDDAGWTADSVGGLTLGADPIACAISYASARSTKPLRAFTVRKEPKTHGTGKLIEGPFSPGDRVVVIEDTITTGGSARKAMHAVRDAGGIVVGVLALVDREEGGREALEAEGVRVVSLTRAGEIVPRIPDAHTSSS
jgi:orotate phosphoribosyltransferase